MYWNWCQFQKHLSAAFAEQSDLHWFLCNPINLMHTIQCTHQFNTHQFDAHNSKHTSVDVFRNQGKSLSIAKPVSLYEPHGNVRVEWVPGWNESYFSTFENNNYCIKFLDDLRNIWLKWRKWLRYLSAARINICFPPSHLICPHHIFVKYLFYIR